MRIRIFLFATMLIVCNQLIRAQLISGNSFMKGNYVEVGMGPCGTYGTSIDAPAGYHPRGNGFYINRLGFVADANKDGWGAGSPNYCGDYFVPGTPEEGFGLQINGINYNNNLLCSEVSIPGSITDYKISGTNFLTTWQGQIAGVQITSVTKVPMNDVFFITEVTLKNISATSINNLYYMRNVDPDNEVTLPGGSYTTSNLVVAENPNPFSRALVSATGLSYGCYLGLGTKDCRARVSWGGFSNRNPADVWNGTAGLSHSGSSTNDIAISVAFKINSLAPGESASFKFAHVLAASDLERALDLTDPTMEVNGIPVLDNSTIQVCAGVAVPLHISNGSGFDWTWAPSEGLNPIIGASVDATVNALKTYVATGTNSCGSITSLTVTLDPSLTSSIGTVGTIAGPTAVCLPSANQTYSVAPVSNAALYEWTVPSGVSIVGGDGTNTINVSFSSAFSGNITVKAKNGCGISNTSVLPVVGAVSIIPTINCPANIITNASPNQCGANVSFSASGTGSISYSHAPGSYFPVGSTIVTVTATTACGTTNCNFTITVQDNEPPVITCPANIVINNKPGFCGAVVNYGSNEFYSTNNSGTSLIKINALTGAVTNVGPFGFGDTWALGFKPDGTAWTTINWGQLARVNLNTGTATPIGTPFGFTAICLDANSSGQLFTIGWDANLYTVNTTTGALTFVANTGLASVMDIAFDASNKLWAINSSGKLYSVNTTTGLATLESSLSGGISIGSEMGLAISPDGTFYMTEWTGSPRLFSVNPATGVTTLISSLAASLPHGGDFSPVGGVPTATDNCGIPSVTYNPVSGSFFPIGTTTVKATATDAVGNTSTCSFTVTVSDSEKPTVIKGSIESCYLTVAAAEAAALEATTYSDNCSSFEELDVQVSTAGACSAVITVTVTDASNNSSSETYTTRIDNTSPVLNLTPASISVNCQSVPPVPTVTASDNCDGSINVTLTPISTKGSDPAQSSYYNYTITRKWFATDGCGNTVGHMQIITVRDVTDPDITCPADKLNVPFDFGQLYATISIGTATATDNCAANANIAIAGTRSDNVAISNQQYPLGQTTVLWTATDPSDNSDECTQTIIVRKRNTAITYTGDMIGNKICVQYSDIINLQSKLTDNEGLATPNNISGRTITFQLLSGTTVLRSKNATTNASGVAVDTFKIEQAPGMYSVKTIFAGDAYFNESNDQDNCEVKQEDAIVEYNGSQYFTTASSTTMVGSIILAASVNDIDDGSDKRGDIRKAKATFRDGGPAGSVLGSANLPVGLVNPGILTNGISATTQNNINLNSNEASSGGKIFQVWVGASDHYTGAEAGLTPITLALPGQDFVTGGGHLVVTNSAGTYAGTLNSKMNFGFTMKWNKSGKNLQGNINIVFRKWQLYNSVWQWRVYQAKSNAINSMAVVEVGANGQPVSGTNPAAFRKAIINTKANLKDVTDPLNSIDLGGNHNLVLDAWDHITANGGVSDKISITLMGGTTNELLFSSSWASNATAAQTLTGGNINVRNGSGSSATTKNTTSKNTEMEIVEDKTKDQFVVKAYPNPSEHQFTLTISSNLNEAVQIQIYDAAGRKLETISARANELTRFGEKLKTGIYFAQVRQGNKQETIKLIKQ